MIASLNTNGYEIEQTPGDSGGPGRLTCCSPWGRRIRQDLAIEQQKYNLANNFKINHYNVLIAVSFIQGQPSDMLLILFSFTTISLFSISLLTLNPQILLILSQQSNLANGCLT